MDLGLAIALGLGLGLAFGSVWAGIGLVLELSLVWAWVGPGRDPGLGLGLGLEPVLGLGLSLVWDLGLVLVLAWCRSVSNFGKNPGGLASPAPFWHEDETGKEGGLGKERKLGLKRVGDTHLKLKSWVGAGGCCETGTWTREGPAAWTKETAARGRNRQ